MRRKKPFYPDQGKTVFLFVQLADQPCSFSEQIDFSNFFNHFWHPPLSQQSSYKPYEVFVRFFDHVGNMFIALEEYLKG